MLKGKFITLTIYIRKEKVAINSIAFHLKIEKEEKVK